MRSRITNGGPPAPVTERAGGYRPCPARTAPDRSSRGSPASPCRRVVAPEPARGPAGRTVQAQQPHDLRADRRAFTSLRGRDQRPFTSLRGRDRRAFTSLRGWDQRPFTSLRLHELAWPGPARLHELRLHELGRPGPARPLPRPDTRREGPIAASQTFRRSGAPRSRRIEGASGRYCCYPEWLHPLPVSRVNSGSLGVLEEVTPVA
jgi:hypothetical protein